jgi:hypothetical protein
VVKEASRQFVRYELEESGMVIEGKVTTLKKLGITPLLYIPLSGQSDTIKIVCATCDYYDVYVVLRPRKMEQEQTPYGMLGKFFELSLLNSASNPTRYKCHSPSPCSPKSSSNFATAIGVVSHAIQTSGNTRFVQETYWPSCM